MDRLEVQCPAAIGLQLLAGRQSLNDGAAHSSQAAYYLAGSRTQREFYAPEKRVSHHWKKRSNAVDIGDAINVIVQEADPNLEDQSADCFLSICHSVSARSGRE